MMEFTFIGGAASPQLTGVWGLSSWVVFLGLVEDTVV
jgi:hypothetical protein